MPGFLTLYSVSLPAELFCTKRGYSIFCDKYTIEVLTLKVININVMLRIVTSDWRTFSWSVATCNLGHPAMGPLEALWNTVKLHCEPDF